MHLERQRAPHRTESTVIIDDFLKRFERLPDDSVVPDQVAATLLGISPWTLRRSDPVRRIKISARCYGRRVGDIRALIRGEQPSAA